MDDPVALPPSRRPNVLWIFGDQHRAQATGYRGDPNVATPNLDNLGRQGVRFDCAVAGAPWCTPFRGALLSGRYPHQSGVVANGIRLPPAQPTVAAAFNTAGYHTAYVGKWHLDGTNDPDHYVPPERRGGFRYWVGNEASNNQHEHYVYGTGRERPWRLRGYVTDAFSDLLIEHLRDHVGSGREEYQPFFAVLSVQPPHGPNVTPTNPPYAARNLSPAEVKLRRNVPAVSWVEEKARYELAGYYAQIENLDYNVGRIRQALIDLGVDRDTYLIFFSDHGEMGGSHGQFDKRAPYEESIRVPFIVHRGGGCQMNTAISDAAINHVDIAPTSLGLCAIPVPETMVGYDYSAQCLSSAAPEYAGPPRRQAEPHSAYLQQIPPRPFAVGADGTAPASFLDCVNLPWRGVVTRDGWKYACTPGGDWLLFNLAEDPFEQANQVFNERYRTQKEHCHRLLAEWIATTGDHFPLPDIALRERGTPAEQYRQHLAERGAGT